MQKKLTAVLLVSFLAITVSGCSSSGPSCKLMAFWPQMPSIANTCPHERQYVVCGRVVDNQANPIEHCNVVLIKRKYGYGPCGSKEGATLAEFPVAMTDQTGDYSLVFEPLEANDIWLYFDASEKGYNPQFVELNHLMGPTIFQSPGNSPLVLDMTLERAMWAYESKE